jgi:phospholipid/cholesterol/gamma-HCH transport system substrate-binding protein
METRANYVAVGAFVMACIIGLVITILWLAGVQYAQEYEYYQTYFKGPVTGLGKGTTVRYNGIEVGRIAELAFDPNDPQRVIVTMQLQPNLNIREDSLASIETQGLTGGTYVEIDGGTVNSPRLVAKPGETYPVIKAKASTLMELEESAPKLIAKLNEAGDRVNRLLSDQNERAISQILANLNETTGVIAHRSGNIDSVLRNADNTMRNLNDASQKIGPLVADANVDLNKFGKLATDADDLVKGPAAGEVAGLVADMRKLVDSLTRLSDELNREPTKLLFGDRRKGYSPK